MRDAEGHLRSALKRSAAKTRRKTMGRRSRVKGFKWERDVAALLRTIFGPQVRRGLQAQAHAGNMPPDVDGTPFWVECKHHKLVNLRAGIRQAVKDRDAASDKRMPVVFAKDDRTKPLVVMQMDDFVALLDMLPWEDTDAETEAVP